MGEVASLVRSLSCTDCAKYVCNGASLHSQCCDDQDGCNCDLKTEETKLQPSNHEDLEIEMDSGCNDLCCSCLVKAHK